MKNDWKVIVPWIVAGAVDAFAIYCTENLLSLFVFVFPYFNQTTWR